MKHWTTYGATCSKFGVKNFIIGYTSHRIVRFKMACSSFMLLAWCIDMIVTSHWIQGIILDSTYPLGISITKRTIHASNQLTVYYGVLLVWYSFPKAAKEAVNVANWGIHLPAFPERGLGETGEERAIAPLVNNVRSRQCCIERLLKKDICCQSLSMYWTPLNKVLHKWQPCWLTWMIESPMKSEKKTSKHGNLFHASTRQVA